VWGYLRHPRMVGNPTQNRVRRGEKNNQKKKKKKGKEQKTLDFWNSEIPGRRGGQQDSYRGVRARGENGHKRGGGGGGHLGGGNKKNHPAPQVCGMQKTKDLRKSALELKISSANRGPQGRSCSAARFP